MPIEIRGVTPLLQVFDMPVSIRFYRDVLGFDFAGRSGEGDDVDWALLRGQGVEIMLNTAYERPDRPPQPELARVAAHDDTCLFFGCPDVEGAYRHLRETGIDAKPPSVAPYGIKQLYVHDPDGYNLCFQYPATEETRQQWRDWYGAPAAEA